MRMFPGGTRQRFFLMAVVFGTSRTTGESSVLTIVIQEDVLWFQIPEEETKSPITYMHFTYGTIHQDFPFSKDPLWNIYYLWLKNPEEDLPRGAQTSTEPDSCCHGTRLWTRLIHVWLVCSPLEHMPHFPFAYQPPAEEEPMRENWFSSVLRSQWHKDATFC